MKYRKYIEAIKLGAVIFGAVSLGACASTNSRELNSVDVDEKQETIQGIDGREPASMKGDFSWLNEVEDDFSRIAAETSSRALASQNKREVLVKQKDWNFSFLPKTNHFYVEVEGVSYKMIQTKINDGERFAFAAEGQAENPLTLAVSRSHEGRVVASKEKVPCDAEISFWNKKSKAYVTEKKQVVGKSCETLIAKLKDYVP